MTAPTVRIRIHSHFQSVFIPQLLQNRRFAFGRVSRVTAGPLQQISRNALQMLEGPGRDPRTDVTERHAPGREDFVDLCSRIEENVRRPLAFVFTAEYIQHPKTPGPKKPDAEPPV